MFCLIATLLFRKPKPPLPLAQSSTISPGQSLQYTLRFTSSDPSAIQYVSQGGSHQVTVSMTAWSSAAIYSEWVTVSEKLAVGTGVVLVRI